MGNNYLHQNNNNNINDIMMKQGSQTDSLYGDDI